MPESEFEDLMDESFADTSVLTEEPEDETYDSLDFLDIIMDESFVQQF